MLQCLVSRVGSLHPMNFKCQRRPKASTNEFFLGNLQISGMYLICSRFRNSAIQLQSPFPMPSLSTQRSPSLISTASSTTQAMKKAVKSFKKAVKNGVAAVARPFKMRRTSLGSGVSAAGNSGAHLSFSCLPTPADRCILVGGRNSTRQTSVVDSDEEDDPQPVEETPEEELSTFWGSELLLPIQVLIFAS
jgi:hypothetical protein